MFAVLYSSTALTVLSVASLFVGFTIIFVFGICSKKKAPPPADVDMSGFGAAPLVPSGGPGAMAVPQGGENRIDSFANFPGYTGNGMANNREAPDLMKNKDGFDMQSVNFSNISDFRGDNINKSFNVQKERANMSSAFPAVTQPKAVVNKPPGPESESEYDSEYDSEESSADEKAEAAPTAPQRITIQGRPAMPSSIDPESGLPTSSKSMQSNPKSTGSLDAVSVVSKKPPPGLLFEPPVPRPPVESVDSVKDDLQHDLEAGITQYNPKSPAPPNFNILTPSVNRGQVNMESFAFTRGPVLEEVEPDESVEVRTEVGAEKKKKKRRVRKKTRAKKMDASGNPVKRRTRQMDPVNASQISEVKRSRKRVHKKHGTSEI